jgi:hypothetical protein
LKAIPVSKLFASIAEAAAAAILLTLGITACQSFAPNFQTEFVDKRGTTFTALPDFYHAPTNTYIEYKSHALGSIQSFSASEKKMRAQYQWRFKGPSTGMSINAVGNALWKSNWSNDCLEYQWNHQLHKHLIVQRAIGRENYIVVFSNKLSQEDTDDYTKKGLFFLHISQLETYLTP